MSRALFENQALYRGDKPTAKEVELLDGTKGVFYIADIRDHQANDYFAERKKGNDEEELAAAKLCAVALREADGSECISVEQAGNLKTIVRKRLVHAILDVNGFIAPEKSAGN